MMSLVSFLCLFVFLSGMTNKHLRGGISSLGFGRKSVTPPSRNEAELASLPPALLGPVLSFNVCFVPSKHECHLFCVVVPIDALALGTASGGPAEAPA